MFLDVELDDENRRDMARMIVNSGYAPKDVLNVLWDEVYPVVGSNLGNPAGQWEGFDLDWLQDQILSRQHQRTWLTRIAKAMPHSAARLIHQEWHALLPFLPAHFRENNERRD
jgi:hypothetical protein